jgi:outer membrane lipoprotein-sorting protein
LKFVPMRIRKALAMGFIGMAPALTGCLTHTRSVPKTHPAAVVLNATLDQLLKQVDERFNAVQTVNAAVEVLTSVGGGEQGHVTQYPSLSGYIFVRKPEDLRLLLRVPILGSQAIDMVSNGKTWKLWVPRKNLAMEGTNEVTQSSEHGLESLRPVVIFDSLMIRGLRPSQIVALTSDTRIVADDKNKKDLTEEPDYVLEILAQPQGQAARTIRVIHISRTNLLPYQQDIYGEDGNVVTRAIYSNYQQFGDTPFPMKIEVSRPQDHYSLTITVTKLSLNQKLDDDQFEVKIPDGVPIKKMN